MNRENKKESFKKGHYKTHVCSDTFTCKVCGRTVVPCGAGTRHRNHCPNCLSSFHVDNEPGDRKDDCGGVMEPIAVWVRKGGEWAIIHRCRICGHLSSNRIAADDNPMKLMSLAMKPVVQPPFPLESIEEMMNLMGGDGQIIK
ncbi:MAG: RNHCP domain-containing protein [Clostridia bacterium]|nr:RNHCP domain-containing protein [Clostridia bacterium]